MNTGWGVVSGAGRATDHPSKNQILFIIQNEEFFFGWGGGSLLRFWCTVFPFFFLQTPSFTLPSLFPNDHCICIVYEDYSVFVATFSTGWARVFIGERLGCGKDEFLCGDQRCIPVSWQCDGSLDCSDGLDEWKENCDKRRHEQWT